MVIAEVKAGRCSLNGPWTNEERENVQRVLAAIGCLPTEQIDRAAAEIYRTGYFEDATTPLRIRLIAIGSEENSNVKQIYPVVAQVVWSDILGFIFERFSKCRNQKAQTDHWDKTGHVLKKAAVARRITHEAFVQWGLEAMEEWKRKNDAPWN